MTPESYIPWEDRPACWSWEPLPLPQPCSRWRLKDWQAGRCAVCGSTPPALFDDHDHATGDTRGYLCPGCNTAEGVSVRPIFENYRARPPVRMLGMQLRYKLEGHPITQAAEREWERALTMLDERARKIVAVMYTEHLRRTSGWFPREHRIPPMTALMRAALEVGLTWEEWSARNDLIRDWEWDDRRGDPRRTLAEASRPRADDPACQVRLLRWALHWSDAA